MKKLLFFVVLCGDIFHLSLFAMQGSPLLGPLYKGKNSFQTLSCAVESGDFPVKVFVDRAKGLVRYEGGLNGLLSAAVKSGDLKLLRALLKKTLAEQQRLFDVSTSQALVHALVCERTNGVATILRHANSTPDQLVAAVSVMGKRCVNPAVTNYFLYAYADSVPYESVKRVIDQVLDRVREGETLFLEDAVEAIAANKLPEKSESQEDCFKKILFRGKRDEAEQFLHEHPEALDEASPGCLTPLAHAAFLGRDDVVMFLHAKGAKNVAQDSFGNTPLHYAFNEKVAKLLVEQSKGSGECKANEGQSGNARLVGKVLCPAVVARNNGGDTPLHAACRYGRFAVAKVLLEHGACVCAENQCGETPLQLCGGVPNEEDLRKLLLAHKAEPLCSRFAPQVWPFFEQKKADDCM